MAEMNATTLEIPRESWPDYFRTVDKTYGGWSTVVEVLGRDLGDQPAAEGLRLQGISYETAGSDAGNILIELGDQLPALMTHHVDHPRAVRAADTVPGAETDIQIECEDGSTVLVHLRARPELPPS